MIKDLDFRLIDGRSIDFVNGDIQFPAILYKYRDFDDPYHRMILENNCLYFPSPKIFHKDDPFDCNLEREFLNDDELRIFYDKQCKEQHPLFSGKEKRRWARKMFRDAPIRKASERDKIIEKNKETFYKIMGVFSSCESPNEERMWDVYANKEKGICIGFDTQKLMQVIKMGGPVTYPPELPKLNYQRDGEIPCMLTNIFYKQQKWEYEREYRLCTIALNTKNGLKEEERTIQLPTDCIKEVILGSQISKKNENAIRLLMSEKHPNASLKNKQ